MIGEFPNQLEDAISIVETTEFSGINISKVQNILISGMGGSGIGGDFVKAICSNISTKPIAVSKRYTIPAWVNEKTLVICNSYSGNTEETLTSYELAIAKGAQIVCISSGGKLLEMARENGHSYIRVPNSYSSPRACLGYSIVAQLGVLNHLKLVQERWKKEILRAADLLRAEQEKIRIVAGDLAGKIKEKEIVIYSEVTMEPLAMRWRQQINENAKTLCWHHVIPEMNHNELVGWKDEKDIAVFFLRSSYNSQRNSLRMDINKKIIEKCTSSIFDLYGKGNSFIEHILYLVNIGDWISYELALLKGRDVEEVNVIDYLKSELSKVN